MAMARYTNPRQLLAKQKAMIPKVEAKAKEIHLKAVRDTEKEIREKLLSGPLSPEDERRMGHPYAKIRMSRRGYRRERLKGGKVLSTKMVGVNTGAGISVSLLPINHQTGDLARSAAILRFPVANSGDQELRLAYRSAHAKYVLAKPGTRYMRARGFQTKQREISVRIKRESEYAIRLMILNAAATGRV